MSAILLHPAIAALHAQIQALRDELAAVVAHHDDLRHTAIPYFKAIWQQAVGPAQLAALQAQVAAQRAKRQVELAMQAVNCGQPAPPLSTIQAQVAVELTAWQARVTALADEVSHATRTLAHCLDANDTAELKQHYRTLVRALHPDVAADHDAARWTQVQAAYRDGDLARLRLLTETLTADAPLPSSDDAITALEAHRERLQQSILAVVAATVQLEGRPPLSQRAQYADPTWIAERIAGFHAQAEAWRAAAAQWQQRLLALYPPTPLPEPSQN